MIEKSKDMEKRYEGGVDTWGNRERRLYQKIFKKAVEIVKDYLKTATADLGSTSFTWYDIGAGGGNIWDTVLENNTPDCTFNLRGCDLSDVALRDLESRYDPEVARATKLDLEEYNYEEIPTSYDSCQFQDDILTSNVVSIVDVAYYFGDKRPWKQTMDEIWKSITPGTVVVVADSLIPYQRRSYFSTLPDCTTIADYTDYTTQVSEERRENGRIWHRYLKVKIYVKGVA